MIFNSDTDSQDIVSTILDKSGAKSINVYPLKRIARNFNAALDMYFSWAFEVDGRWSFDDINEASPPIDTQNLVSGTNRYKFGTFTEKIISLIKLEALDSNGTGIELKPENINEISSSSSFGDNAKTFQELYISADSGTPSHYCKYGDFVYLRPNPNYSYTGGLVAYFNRPATYVASSTTNTTPGTPGIHHPLLCDLTANMFKYDKNMMSLSEKMAFEQYAESVVKDYFSKRDEETRKILTGKIKSFR